MKHVKKRIALYILIVLAFAGFFWWNQQTWQFDVLASAPLERSDGAFRSVAVEFRNENVSFVVDIVRFPAFTYSAKIIDQPEYDDASWQTLIDEQNPIALINGGYFDGNFDPDGMLRIDEQIISKPNHRLSGAVTINKSSIIQLLSIEDVKDEHLSVLQTGPMIIEPGGMIGIASDDFKNARRSVIAMAGNGDLLLFVTSDVSLYQLAMCLREIPEAFDVESIDVALNLDGGPSSGLYVQSSHGLFKKPPDDRTRNVILID